MSQSCGMGVGGVRNARIWGWWVAVQLALSDQDEILSVCSV